MTRSRLVAFGVAALALVLAVAVAHHAIATFALQRILSAVSGVQVRFADMHLGPAHASFTRLHVATNAGDPLLDAARVDVDYTLRDLLPGGHRLYGLRAIVVDRPVITLLRRGDGSYNLAALVPSAPAKPASPATGPPLRASVRVRDGEIRLADAAPLEPDLATQSFTGLRVDAAIDTSARSTIRAGASMLARQTQTGALAAYPIAVRSTTDLARGFTVTRARVARLPLRGLLNFLIHSPVARFDDGALANVNVVAYALDLGGTRPLALRLGGGADLGGVRIAVDALAKPIKDLRGHIDLFDDGVTTSRLDGDVAGVPLRVRGGVYDFANLQFRIGIGGDAELGRLKALFAFLAPQPVRGVMHLETLVTSTVTDPLIRTALSAHRAYYGAIPLDGLHGIVDYERSGVTFTGVHTGFGPLRATTSGNVDVHDPNAVIEAFVDAAGPAAGIPYAQAVASDATIDAQAVINGTGSGGFRVGGTIAADGRDAHGTGFVAVDERGTGEFGPFAFDHRDGSELAGALRLERRTDASAGWLYARDYRLDIPAHPATLPGVVIPPFPAVGGRIDAAIVAGGPPSDFAIAGHVHARRSGFERYAIGDADLGLAGTLADLRLQNVRVDGPIGRFRGGGAVHGGLFALGGTYDGSLDALAPFTGRIDAHGPVHAPVLALVDGRGVTVQTDGAAMAGANIRGFPIDRAAGTLRVGADGLHIVAADADVQGRHAVAASTDGRVAVSAAGIPAAALAAAGVPLTAGTVSIFGLANLRGPSFAGSVDLANGVTQGGYPAGGWADLAVAGSTLTVRDGMAGLGTTYARIGGRLERIGDPAPRYALSADVPLGDVAALAGDLRLPVRNVEGTFAASIRVAGAGARPELSGSIAAPEGSYNGLNFTGGNGRIVLDTAPVLRLQLDDGHVRVGSSALRFAVAAGGAFALHLAGDAVNLADFDDYFDPSGVLDGTGSAALDFTDTGGNIRTFGRVRLTGTRLRRFPLGDVDAQWGMRGRRVAGALRTASADGQLGAAGTLTPGIGDPLPALAAARYDADVRVSGVRLESWLPALGVQFPVLGDLAGQGHVTGVFPRLAIGGAAAVTGGRIGPYAVTTATVRTHVLGERVGIDAAVLDLGFAKLTSSGFVGVDPADPLNLHVHASVADVGEAARQLSRSAPDVGGALEADALVAGSYGKPRITVGFDLENGHYGLFDVKNVIGNLESDFRSVRLDSAEVGFAHGTAQIAGSLPLSFDPPGIGPPSAPLSLSAEARDVDLAPLAPLLPGGGTKLGGTVNGRLALGGTVRSPRVFGTATLTGGAYVSDVETSPIHNLDATLAFAGTSVALQRMHGNVGAGTIDASGRLELPLPDAPPTSYSIDLIAKGAQLNLPGYGGGSLSGNAQIVSGTRRPRLSGDVVVYNTTIPFATIFRATGAGEGENSGPPFDLGLNLRVESGQNVRLRSSIIDVGATGVVTLTGTLLAPRAAGTLTAVRGGVFSTYQRLFRIADATVTFDPAQGIVPNLDLHATAHVTNPDPDTTRNTIGSADITVAVTGPADSYTVSYESQPPYSQAQIVALLAAIPFVGTVNFNQPQLPGTLRGAPGASNVLLPPGVTPYQTGAYNFQQEAFSLLNTQLTQRLLSPVENSFGGAIGLTDLELTLDYGGRVGYTARKQISKKKLIDITLGQILSYPVRTQVGITARPNAVTSAIFSYFTQNGTASYQNSIFGNTSTVEVLNGVQPLSNRQGFSAVLSRSY